MRKVIIKNALNSILSIIVVQIQQRQNQYHRIREKTCLPWHNRKTVIDLSQASFYFNTHSDKQNQPRLKYGWKFICHARNEHQTLREDISGHLIQKMTILSLTINSPHIFLWHSQTTSWRVLLAYANHQFLLWRPPTKENYRRLFMLDFKSTLLETIINIHIKVIFNRKALR